MEVCALRDEIAQLKGGEQGSFMASSLTPACSFPRTVYHTGFFPSSISHNYALPRLPHSPQSHGSSISFHPNHSFFQSCPLCPCLRSSVVWTRDELHAPQLQRTGGRLCRCLQRSGTTTLTGAYQFSDRSVLFLNEKGCRVNRFPVLTAEPLLPLSSTRQFQIIVYVVAFSLVFSLRLSAHCA